MSCFNIKVWAGYDNYQLSVDYSGGKSNLYVLLNGDYEMWA